MSVPIKTFRNVRVRVSRRNPEMVAAGWVTHFSREEVRVRLWDRIRFDLNETISGQCYGQGTVARFNGKIVAQADFELAIDLIGSITYLPSDETPRIYAGGVSGKLTGSNKTVNFQALDVSPLSLGGVVDGEFQSGVLLEMSLTTEFGPVDARVSVVNSREDPDRPGNFRLGMNIIQMKRLDQARWDRLVADRAAA